VQLTLDCRPPQLLGWQPIELLGRNIITHISQLVSLGLF
jgi:hypothetical protein